MPLAVHPPQQPLLALLLLLIITGLLLSGLGRAAAVIISTIAVVYGRLGGSYPAPEAARRTPGWHGLVVVAR